MSKVKDHLKPSLVTIPGAVQFDMASKISGRTYRIFVFRPPAPPPPEGYPVLTVTDASLTFPTAAIASGTFGFQGGQAALVVGVGYPTDDPMAPFVMRLRDLTPPTPLGRIRQTPGQPPIRTEDYGGSPEFLRFLIEELRPAIAAAYPVNAGDQTLYGHSLGGLFALQALFEDPGSFRSFVASSPSIWWNRRALLRGEARLIKRLEAGPAAPRILIMAGADEQTLPERALPGMTRAQMTKLLKDARMVDNARELAERLGQVKGKAGYTVRYQAFEAEDHMTVVPASISRALAFALRP